MKEIPIHDILEAPYICRPVAVRQEGNVLHVMCPWCGEQVGDFDFGGKTYNELLSDVLPLMYKHLAGSPSCNEYVATVKLKFLGRPMILPELLDRWISLGILI